MSFSVDTSRSLGNRSSTPPIRKLASEPWVSCTQSNSIMNGLTLEKSVTLCILLVVMMCSDSGMPNSDAACQNGS